MEQRIDCLNPEDIMISVEEFDSLEGAHDFSEKYKENKEKILKKYRRSMFWQSEGRKMMLSAAVAVLAVFAVEIVGEAANSELFYRIWGTLGRENVESHEEILYDQEKGTSAIVTYPKREYTDANLERAEELIGEAVSYGPIEKEIGDARLTVLTSVCDGNAAVVEFTLEGKDIADALHYSQLDNESKGAWFAEDAPFSFCFADCRENIFVDLNKSTEDLLYCYDYMVMQLPESRTADTLTMEIYQNLPEEEKWEVAEKLSVPITSKAAQTEYCNEAGGRITISPISMKIDMGMVPGLAEEEAGDPWHAYYVAVNYKDGTTYVIHEHGIEGVHSCGTDIDNASYTLENLEKQLIFVFNRLVDMEEIESITVNETLYLINN